MQCGQCRMLETQSMYVVLRGQALRYLPDEPGERHPRYEHPRCLGAFFLVLHIYLRISPCDAKLEGNFWGQARLRRRSRPRPQNCHVRVRGSRTARDRRTRTGGRWRNVQRVQVDVSYLNRSSCSSGASPSRSRTTRVPIKWGTWDCFSNFLFLCFCFCHRISVFIISLFLTPQTGAHAAIKSTQPLNSAQPLEQFFRSNKTSLDV